MIKTFNLITTDGCSQRTLTIRQDGPTIRVTAESIPDVRGCKSNSAELPITAEEAKLLAKFLNTAAHLAENAKDH